MAYQLRPQTRTIRQKLLETDEIIMSETFSSIKEIFSIILDFLIVVLKILYYICEATFKLFVPKEKKDVSGEIVLITGAGDGIGKQLAIGYASLGATVVCWDINKETNEQTMNEIKIMGNNSVYAYQCDVSNKNEVFKMAEKVKMEVGDVTILINNAGIAPIRTLLDYKPEEISRIIDINLMAHYWTVKAFLPSMIEKNHGHIVGISSILATVGGIHGTVYCASKAAVRLLMESIDDELYRCNKGKSFVKTTTIFPSLVATNMTKSIKLRRACVGNYLPQQIAPLIINAQRQDYKEKFLPSHMYLISVLIRIIPNKVKICIQDFLGIDFL